MRPLVPSPQPSYNHSLVLFRYNAADGAKVLGIDAAAMDREWERALEADKVCRFGSGFYIALYENVGVAQVHEEAVVMVPQFVPGVGTILMPPPKPKTDVETEVKPPIFVVNGFYPKMRARSATTTTLLLAFLPHHPPW